ncbi:MAG: Hpt domain-containing protein [Chloroflexota bacterium]
MTVFNAEVTPKNEIMQTMKEWLSESLGDAFDIMLPELAEMYLEDGPVLLGEIKSAIAEQDPKALKESSHALKGSSASMGLANLAQHCQVVENCSKTADFATATMKMPQVEAEFNQVISLFQEMV